MKYPFQMYGRIIQIYRYSATYIERRPNRANETNDIEVTRYFVNEKEAQRKGGTVIALDTSTYEWLDGIEVDDVPNTYGEAIRIYNMGETAYKEELAFKSAKNFEQIRADLDYLMLMGGLK